MENTALVKFGEGGYYKMSATWRRDSRLLRLPRPHGNPDISCRILLSMLMLTGLGSAKYNVRGFCPCIVLQSRPATVVRIRR
jgi:hypothetical protein